MLVVGVIEIIAGIGVLVKPRVFAYIVALWLLLESTARVSVLLWLRVRLLSLDFDVFSDVSRLSLLEWLFVTSEDVVSVALMSAPRL